MFKLVAEAHKGIYDGVVSAREFPSLEEAETCMRNWARFGVDGLCDEADRLFIKDRSGAIVRVWSRREKRSVCPV